MLISSAPGLVLPYTAPILKALVAKLRMAAGGQGTTASTAATAGTITGAGPTPGGKVAPVQAEDGFVVSVLVTMGELARVAGTRLRPSVPEILPLIIDAIQDGSSPAKRLVAVSGRRGLVAEQRSWDGFEAGAGAGGRQCAGAAGNWGDRRAAGGGVCGVGYLVVDTVLCRLVHSIEQP